MSFFQFVESLYPLTMSTHSQFTVVKHSKKNKYAIYIEINIK